LLVGFFHPVRKLPSGSPTIAGSEFLLQFFKVSRKNSFIGFSSSIIAAG